MLRYFKKIDKSSSSKGDYPKPGPGQPDPNSQEDPVAASQCAAANAEINREHEKSAQGTSKRKRGEYAAYTEEQRLKIARYAVDNGPTKAARHFSALLGRSLNESTVRSIRDQYRQRLQAKLSTTPAGEAMEPMVSLPRNKRGSSTLLPSDVDSAVQRHLRGIREAGGIVNRTIVLATGKGILRASGQCHSRIELTRTWAASIMSRMNFVQRKGTRQPGRCQKTWRRSGRASLRGSWVWHRRSTFLVSEYPG